MPGINDNIKNAQTFRSRKVKRFRFKCPVAQLVVTAGSSAVLRKNQRPLPGLAGKRARSRLVTSALALPL